MALAKRSTAAARSHRTRQNAPSLKRFLNRAGVLGSVGVGVISASTRRGRPLSLYRSSK
jgi:hypothetical protein